VTTATATLDSTHPYTLRGIMQMLGLSRHAVQGLVDMGFVRPERSPGPGRPWRFSFRDVVLLRTAQELRAARIPTRQLLRALRRLHKALPHAVPAGALRIQAVGDRVAVRWGGTQWDAESGQLLMDFSAAAAPAAASVLALDGRSRRRPPSAAPEPLSSAADDAAALYAQAEAWRSRTRPRPSACTGAWCAWRRAMRTPMPTWLSCCARRAASPKRWRCAHRARRAARSPR